MAYKSRSAAALTGIGLLVIGPFAVVHGLLFLEHASPWHSQLAELLFVITGVALGAVGIWLLPVRRLFRGLLMVPYVALMAIATWVSALPTVCAYFGDCL
jgi:hypothetical protein